MRFAQDVKSNGAITASRRREVAEHIGLAAIRPVAIRILDELDARGVFMPRLRASNVDAKLVDNHNQLP